MILSILIAIFTILGGFFLWLSQAGDNPDAHALAGIFMIPALGCLGIAALIMIVKIVSAFI